MRKFYAERTAPLWIERGQWTADGLGVDDRTVARNDPLRLEPLEPRLHSRDRQTRRGGQVGERGASVAGDLGDDPLVDSIIHAGKNNGHKQ